MQNSKETIIYKIFNMTPDITVVGSIFLAYFLDRIFPIVEIFAPPLSLIGWLVVAAGLSFAIRILSALRSKHTSSDSAGMPSALIMDGFYAFSRNPMYLSYVIITMGAAIALGSLAALIAPIICVTVLASIIIPLEERNLKKIFGQKYEQYKHKVRRWI